MPIVSKKASKSSPVQAAILRNLIRCFGALSWPMTQRLGAWLGLATWWLPNSLRRTTLENLVRCFPDMSQAERSQLARHSLVEAGKSVVESGPLWNWRQERLLELEVEFVGWDLVADAHEQGAAVLALAPHLGNWEFALISLNSRATVMPLYRQPRIAELDEYLRQSRQRLGAELVPATSAGVRRLARALQEGRVVAILPDQEPLKKHGVFAPFFGHQALTMTLAGSLARRYDPLVVICFAERVQGAGFRVTLRPAPAALKDPDPVVAATALNAAVEECARLLPSQYTWSYRRFKTRPAEELAAMARGKI